MAFSGFQYGPSEIRIIRDESGRFTHAEGEEGYISICGGINAALGIRRCRTFDEMSSLVTDLYGGKLPKGVQFRYDAPVIRDLNPHC